ncbi:hypothetical protein [Paenirhodobacter sp.]|uniref:hypothetical protein n=1 Tax=Paenirhodobacter sp. TaxID=1965326 RepID=UPI003B50648B
MADSPHSSAKKAAMSFIREAREVGWARVRFSLRPDGTVDVDLSMIDQEGGDDFLDADLRMGGK